MLRVSDLDRADRHARAVCYRAPGASGRGQRRGRRRAGAGVGTTARGGIATVHDSGLERAHVVDVAEAVGVPFAEIGPVTVERLADLLDPGLDPANPLDVWGTGADARDQLAGSLAALAADPAVAAVALAVDLVHRVRRRRLLPAGRAGRRRRHGQAGGRAEQRAQRDRPRHRGAAARGRASRCWRAPAPGCSPCATCWTTPGRRRPGGWRPTARGPGPPGRWAEVITAGAAHGGTLFRLLADYGIRCAQARPAESVDEALAAAARRSATRWCSRPMSRGSGISPTPAASSWASRTRPGCGPPTPGWPPGWARAVSGLRDGADRGGTVGGAGPGPRPGPAAGRRGGRHPGRTARRPGRGAAPGEPGGGRAAAGRAADRAAARPAYAASPPPTWPRRRRPSPRCHSSRWNWAACWTPWTSTR